MGNLGETSISSYPLVGLPEGLWSPGQAVRKVGEITAYRAVANRF